MSNGKSSLRFDHREIAVIFSLFIFVSLLMFTVGILVGKGLAQAKYEAILLSTEASTKRGEAMQESRLDASRSSSAASEASAEPARAGQREASGWPSVPSDDMPVNEIKPRPIEGGLKLVPKSAAATAPMHSLTEVKSPEAEQLLKDPKIRALVDDDVVSSKTRSIASTSTSGGGTTKLPASYPKGKYTVQVGSYPTEKDASERVEALRKLGFPYAYFSAKELGDQKETWYRVWLGYYPDFESAKRSGEMLQGRGEVRNYLVRKTESNG